MSDDGNGNGNGNETGRKRGWDGKGWDGKTRFPREKLKALLEKNVHPIEIAKELGVSRQRIHSVMRKMKLSLSDQDKAISSTVTFEKGREIVTRHLDTVVQLAHINNSTLSILNLVMAWINGDDNAIQILESQTRKVKVKGKEEVVCEYKMKDPKEIALKACAEIREQLTLQMNILKTLNDIRASQEFQKEVLEEMDKMDPGIRMRILEALKRKRLLHNQIEYVPVK